MSEGSPFSELMDKVREGDNHAAEELVRLYEPHVRRAVRLRMNQPRLRSVVDSIDICQSVLARFFVRAVTGHYDLDTPEQLIGLLVKMAENRVYDWHRNQTTQGRDRAREVPLASHDVGQEVVELPSEDPKETLARLMGRLPNEERELAEAKLRGESWTEIGERVGKSPDALRMRLRRAANEVLKELEGDL